MFTNNWIKVKSQEDSECPIIKLNIITVVNGTAKNNKVSTNCGGEIEKLEKIFSNFSSFVIKLDTKGLNDQDSKVNMNLMIDGECKENGESWINNNNFIWIIFIILISSAMIVAVCCWYCCRKQKHKYVVQDKKKKQKKSRSQSPVAEVDSAD